MVNQPSSSNEASIWRPLTQMFLKSASLHPVLAAGSSQWLLGSNTSLLILLKETLIMITRTKSYFMRKIIKTAAVITDGVYADF